MRFIINSNGFRDHPANVHAEDTLFLTQNITKDLLLHDFEPADDDKESTVTKNNDNLPEELSEKWLLLSQCQLTVGDDEVVQYDESFDDIVSDVYEKTDTSDEISIAVKAPSNSTKNLCNSTKTQTSESKEETSLDRSHSPILISRPAKKKRKVQ